jgi:hypothetical protein
MHPVIVCYVLADLHAGLAGLAGVKENSLHTSSSHPWKSLYISIGTRICNPFRRLYLKF